MCCWLLEFFVLFVFCVVCLWIGKPSESKDILHVGLLLGNTFVAIIGGLLV